MVWRTALEMAGAIHQPPSFAFSTDIAGGEDLHTQYVEARKDLSWKEHTQYLEYLESRKDLSWKEHSRYLECRKDFSWKEFFSDPSKWWDKRSSKQSDRQPDFKHKVTRESLWMHRHDNPSWVKVELVRRGFAEEQCMEFGVADAFLPSLWDCSKNKDLSRGTRIHRELQKMDIPEKSYSDALVCMYAKCGELRTAKELLHIHGSRSIVPWTALIAGYAQKGQGQNALQCFERMQHEGIHPNAVTYVCILKACAAIRAIEKGKQVHDEIFRQGLLKHSPVLGGALVDMYAKCGALPQAHSVLEKLPCRNVVSWSALITGYAQEGKGQQALECFEQMQHEGISPNAVTYVCVLKACGSVGAIDKGKQIHDEISRQGLLEHDLVLGNALVDMYAKCGALTQARNVLEKLPSRDVISWSALIAGYVQKGQGQQALECFEKMQGEGIHPNAVTYACILKVCGVAGAIDKGKQIHDQISSHHLLEHNVMVGSALVDMYAKCGELDEARRILEKLHSRNVISWSALIAGYVQEGNGQKALECFEQMQREGIPPNAVTYVTILKACAVLRDIGKGTEIHDEISRQELLKHDMLVGAALVDMYAKCGALFEAHHVLEELPCHNITMWNALIAGYAQEGQGEQALKCFNQMQQEGIHPDVVTFVCLLNMCSHLGLVEKGQELFDNMGATYGLMPDVECFTCMVDLLGRSGHLMRAIELIQEMPFPASSATWRCLLGACLKWVDVNVASRAFEQAILLDKCDHSAYVLMGNVYTAAGMPEKAKDIEAMRPQSMEGAKV